MKNVLLICIGLLIWSCENTNNSNENGYQETSVIVNEDAEATIKETLKMETQFFCERNLEKWQEQWSQQPFVSKMYGGEKEFKELTTWEEINAYTVNHISENPDAIPIPESDYDLDIHLLGETAWVFYSKIVDDKEVRESRFMVKEGDKWKIARMQTIY